MSLRRAPIWIASWIASLLVLPLSLGGTCTRPPLNDRPSVGSQLFTSPQVNPVGLSCDGSLVYVANTTSGTLSIHETAPGNALVAEIRVGMDPVGVAVRPKATCGDGGEDEQIFVSNHISDSIAVVSRTELGVVQTLQQLDAAGVSETDEPVGIVFAGPDIAFVGLDHPNQILKLEPDGNGDWQIAASTPLVPAAAQNPPADGFTAQAPRALAVSNGRLYVAAFESGNQSEFPSCGAGDPVTYDPNGNGGDGTGCLFPLNIGTLLAFATSPNIGGEVIHNPASPDRDLFVYDTDLGLIDTVEGVGTLLYGMTAVGNTIYVTHTDARNKKDGLDALDGRMFDNRLALLACNAGGCSLTTNVDLDASAGVPVPTPYGIAASANGQVLVASVAGSDGVPADPDDPSTVNANIPGLITLDAAGNVLGHVQTGAIPQGVALRSDGNGDAEAAYVLNTVDSTLSVVDVSNPAAPNVTATFSVGSDPTPAEVKRGRIQFSTARASSSGTFSCESCHPNGNVDQVDWTINSLKGPGDACDPETESCPEPRSTMPIRGLRDTLPLHWAGNLADPFPGVGVGGGEDPVAPDCNIAVVGEVGCIRDLVDASLSGVMCDPVVCSTGPSSLAGALDDNERNDLAAFLAAVAFPPSPQRRPSDALSGPALTGVEDFYTDQGGLSGIQAATCANNPGGCHTLPLTVATNSPVVGGFDAPSIRGLWDRHITFSNGLTSSAANLSAQGFDPGPAGMTELGSLAATFPGLFTLAYNVPVDGIWALINEMSVGLPGLTGRQVSLTAANENNPGIGQQLAEIESAAGEGRVTALASRRSEDWRYTGGEWLPARGPGATTAGLRAIAASGTVPVTVTAHLPENLEAGGAARQPLLAVSGLPDLPLVTGGDLAFSVTGSYVDPAGSVLVDGIRCAGCGLSVTGSTTTITLDALPAPNGIHVVQVLNPEALASNELPICVVDDC